MKTFMKSWALNGAITLAVTGVFLPSTWFYVAAAVFGVVGMLAVAFWLTPLGRAAFAQFEREELAKQRDRLDARLRKLGGPPHVASSDEGRPSSSRSTHRSA